MIAALLLPVASASAATDYTWTGAASSSHWSTPSNWAAGSSPPSGGSVGTLTFPTLTSAPCTASPPTATCFTSWNDATNLSVDALAIDDGGAPGVPGPAYAVGGDGITLGSGGLSASSTSREWG